MSKKSRSGIHAVKENESQLDIAQLEQQLEKSMDHVFELFLGLQKISNVQVKKADALSRRPLKHTYLV